MMRVEQAINVVTILRTGSFRESAQELDISQSALSETVRNLERELGVTLLERGRGRIQPTEVGVRVRPYLEEIASSTGRLREEIALAVAGGTAKLRIGAVAAAVNTLLPGAISDLLTEHPEVQAQVTAAGSIDIRTAVSSGTLDVGLIVVPADQLRDQPDDLALCPLVRSGLGVCVPRTHPFAEFADVELDKVRRENLIVYRRGYLMHEMAHELIGRSDPRVVYRTDNTDTAKTMIAAGVGIALLPEFSVITPSGDAPRDIVWRPLAGGESADIVLAAVHRASGPGAAARAFVDLVRHRADHNGTSVSTSVRSTL